MKRYFHKTLIVIFVAFLFVNGVALADEQIGYRYYYNQLKPFQKQLYEFILSAPRMSSEHRIRIEEDLSNYSEDELFYRVDDTKWACDLDNPEQTSWLNSISYKSCDYDTNEIVFEIIAYTYYDDDDYEKVETILDQIEAGADPTWDNYTKAYYIASAITSCMNFDQNEGFYETSGDVGNSSKADTDKQHITGLINGYAVCEGYTEIFKALADRLDLPCVEVCGKAHAFVHIMMEDGKWYGHEPQNELRLEGSSMYRGAQDQNGWYNIYETSDHVYFYLTQPQRTDGDYPICEINQEISIPDVAAVREELNEGEPQFLYSINDDGTTCTITGYKGRQSGDLVIPQEIDGFTVNAIGNSAFAFCSFFDGNLSIPDTVAFIGSGAFSYCSGLKGDIVFPSALQVIENAAFIGCSGFSGSIVFNNTLHTIGSAAFADCVNISGSLLFPDSLEEIGNYAFRDCRSLNGVIHIPASMDAWNAGVFDSCINLTGFDVSEFDPRYTVIDGILYNKDATELLQCIKGYQGSVIIPEGVVKIAAQAFYQCANITEVQFPSTVREIGDWAFGYLTGRTKSDLVLPSSVITVGDSAFYNSNCSGTIYYPNSDQIGHGAFGWNVDVRRVVIPEGVTTIPNACFDTIQIREAVIPESVTSIGTDAFGGATDMVVIGVPGSYAEQYANENQDKGFRFEPVSHAFLQDTYEIYLDVDGEKYPKQAELTAHWLGTEEQVEFISWTISNPWNFENYSDIAEMVNNVVTAKTYGIVLVTGTTRDGQEANWTVYCSRFPQGIEAGAERTELFIGQEVFVFAPYYPFESQVYGKEMDAYGIITFSSSDPSVVEVVDSNVIKGMNLGTATITATNQAEMSASFEVSVVEKSQLIPSIDDLYVLRLPSSVRVIEERAFVGLSCQAIIIPDGCTTIGEYAFKECYQLQYVKIPSSVRTYPQNAFADCPNNMIIDWQKE